MIVESAPSASEITRKQRVSQLAFEDGEYIRARELLTYRDRIEETLLEYLTSNPNAYKNAYEKLSRNTRIIYVHAYQSYVWNKTVSI